MKRNTIIMFGMLGLGALLAACETVPPTPAQMPASEYETVLNQADLSLNVATADLGLTELLARADLGPMQRANAVLLRAYKRRDGGYDLPGAIVDMETFLELQPMDPRAGTIPDHITEIRERIVGHEARLSVLQTLAHWFDDMVAMGQIETAAARYRGAGLTRATAKPITRRRIYMHEWC